LFKSYYNSRGNWLIFLLVLTISTVAITPLFSIIISLLKTFLINSFSESNILITYIKNSFDILFFVTILTIIFGVLPSYLISFFNFSGVNFFKYALILSLAIPPYIYGYSLSSFFENYGTAFSLLNFLSPNIDNSIIPNLSPKIMTIISLSFSLFGYIYLLSMTTFNSQLSNYIEMARSLGISKFNTISKIIFPLSRPAIFIGISLVAMETLSDFGTVSFFGVSTLTTGIYNSWFIFDDIETSNLLSIVLLGFILCLFYIENKFQKKRKFHDSVTKLNQIKSKNLKGFHNLLAFFICFLIFFISFIFPVLQMIYWSIKHSNYLDNINLLALNLNTLFLIITTSTILISFSFFCNFGNRLLKNNFLNTISSLSISGYAIPGILISIAVITIFSAISNFLDIELKSILIGSFIGLIFGYFFRFYSIAFNGIKSNYLKINDQIDESGYLLGLSKIKIFFKIHFPILKENTFFIFILISLEVIKELPITLILRPFNFETFSTKAFEYASQDLIEAAALPSLFLVLWTTILILFSSKYFLKK